MIFTTGTLTILAILAREKKLAKISGRGQAAVAKELRVLRELIQSFPPGNLSSRLSEPIDKSVPSPSLYLQ